MFIGLVFSLSAQATDLLQVYHQALANDSVYTSARANLSAGQEASVQGRAGLLPAIALSGATQRNSNNGNNYNDATSNSYTLSLSQPLFDVAAWQNYEQSKLSVAASEAAFAVAQQDLILRVAQAYFDVLTAEDALTSLQAEKSAILEQLAFAKRKFEVGTATITDTHEAQARYDLAVAQELSAQNTLDIARSALQQIIGEAPGDLAALRPGVELKKPEPMRMDRWVVNAEEQNFTVVQQQLELEIAKRAITRDRAGHYPTVDLVASRSDNDRRDPTQNNTSGNGPNNAIGVQWNIPLFSGFAVTSRVRQAIALEDRARADLETARRSAAQNARQAFLGVNSGLAQVKALEAAERSSRSALESNRLGYEVGVRINIDVLNAQQQLYSTRSELSKARYDTLMNSLRLKAAAGTLQERDVVEINTLLTQS
ncbi:MAG TPA: TolC family outer membrane protein [Oxalicibacterium sp.]|nr:TolC family outer membrane protein [Oxalicibacterium sp.]